jgi:hypothetical protein
MSSPSPKCCLHARHRARRARGDETHLDGGAFRVELPVVYRGLCDDTEGLWRDPLPKDDLLVHEMSLELLLRADVEDLELTGS